MIHLSRSGQAQPRTCPKCHKQWLYELQWRQVFAPVGREVRKVDGERVEVRLFEHEHCGGVICDRGYPVSGGQPGHKYGFGASEEQGS